MGIAMGICEKPKESNYRTLLDQGQLAACVFAHWWWSKGQKIITMILRGFRTDLFTKAFARGLCEARGEFVGVAAAVAVWFHVGF